MACVSETAHSFGKLNMPTTRLDFPPVCRFGLSLRVMRSVLTMALVWSCLATEGISSARAQDDTSNEIDYPLVLIKIGRAHV